MADDTVATPETIRADVEQISEAFLFEWLAMTPIRWLEASLVWQHAVAGQMAAMFNPFLIPSATLSSPWRPRPSD